MAVTALHTLYAVQVDKADTANDLFADQISNWSLDTAIEEIIRGGDGHVDPTYVAVGSQSPKITFTSSAVARILTLAGISGLWIGAAGDTAAYAWFRALDEGGTRKTGANHIKLTMAKAMLVPRTLNAPSEGEATLDMELLPYSSDGSTAPISIGTSQSLAARPGGQADERFVAGPAAINGTTINGVQNTTIDFGIELIVKGGDGHVFPTFMAIQSRAPKITIQTVDVSVLNTFGISGTVQSSTDSVIYLRKMSEGGTRVANETEEHISFTIDEGRVTTRTLGGGHNEPFMAELQITPTWDETAAIIAVDTSCAIV